jgi:hypothetical protein
VGGVPLVAAAVCPHPPMLVPEVASGAAPELDDLREACAGAVRHLLNAGATSLVVVGSGPSGATSHRPVTASFAPFGTPLEFTLDRATALAPRPLPVSLLVAAWLLRESSIDTSVDVHLYGVPFDATAPDLPPTPRTGVSRRWALLAMGDGSACRTHKAPGYFDPRAEAFDRAVANALAAADPDALLGIDPALATELWCAGRPAWQVLAGQLIADGREWAGDLRYHEAPYGVGYLVSTLTPMRDVP